jgi:hypothetical protein
VSVAAEYLSVSFVTHPTRTDYPVLLRDLLVWHHTGNLNVHLVYNISLKRPGDDLPYSATATCERSGIE